MFSQSENGFGTELQKKSSIVLFRQQHDEGIKVEYLVVKKRKLQYWHEFDGENGATINLSNESVPKIRISTKLKNIIPLSVLDKIYYLFNKMLRPFKGY